MRSTCTVEYVGMNAGACLPAMRSKFGVSQISVGVFGVLGFSVAGVLLAGV